jgi:hypothetical protein
LVINYQVLFQDHVDMKNMMLIPDLKVCK